MHWMRHFRWMTGKKLEKSKEIVCQPSDATKAHKYKKVWVISWGVTPGQEEASQRCNKCVARPSQSLVSKSGALELDPWICCYFTNSGGFFRQRHLLPSVLTPGRDTVMPRDRFSLHLQHSFFFSPILVAFLRARHFSSGQEKEFRPNITFPFK